MVVIKTILLAFIGFSSGALVAAGVFAFVTMIGVVTRLAARTKTNKHILLYEDMVVLGGTIGNIIFLFEIAIPWGNILLIIFGLFTGIFVGCWSVALAEVLKVIPVFSKRIRLKYGMPLIVLVFAIGKGLGSLIQFFFPK